jgi:predicted GIY-YIG superfamily endonuclease
MNQEYLNYQPKRKPKGYWTKEKCIEDAKSYSHKKEWELNSKSAFTIAHRNKWLDDCCSHMIKVGNAYHRAIYALEFSDNSVYIGLTHDLNERIFDHNRSIKSTVFQHIHKTNLEPILKQLTEYLFKNDAIKKEEEFLLLYKKNGWNILNKVKTGSLGGGQLIWSKERCIEDALKYSTKKEWGENSNTAYKKAIKMKWIDECTEHMIPLIKAKLFNNFTLEQCKEFASKFNHRVRFKEAYSGVYSKIIKMKWDKECFSHMKYLHKQPIQ